MDSHASCEGLFAPIPNQFINPAATVTSKWNDFAKPTIRVVLVLAGLVAIFQAPAHAACSAPSTGGIAVCSPIKSSNVNPIHYIAAASTSTCNAGISTMSILSDVGNELYSVAGSTLDTFLPLEPSTTVQATDKCGGTQQAKVATESTGTAMVTYQYSAQRTGANLFETVLTPTNVKSATFGKIFSCDVDSFVYGQPLFMPKLAIAGGTHDTVFVATENNSVYAFDASGKSCTPLWHAHLGTPVPCSTNSPFKGTYCNLVFNTPVVGITSTMLIDPTLGPHGVIYVEARTLVSPGKSNHALHKLDITTGKDMPDSPSVITATIAGNSCDSVKGVVSFTPAAENNRSALLYANGVVYFGFSSVNDAPICPGVAFHGWLLGYNASNIKQQVAVFSTTRNKSTNGSGGGWGGGIWGGALAADAKNDIFIDSGNGAFDSSVEDWSTTLNVADYFVPLRLFDTDDEDLGASTGILLPNLSGPFPHELIGGGKTGTLYVVNRDNMGKYNHEADKIIQEIPGAVGHLVSGSASCDCDYSSPAYWNGRLFVSGVNDRVKEFALSNGKLTGPVSESAETFSYPGSVPTVSANGNSEGIVWVVEPGKGILRAYSAANLADELYNSGQNSKRDALGSSVKFAVPAVVDGRVFVGTKTAVVGYGLLP
jgi:hypothetical protein